MQTAIPHKRTKFGARSKLHVGRHAGNHGVVWNEQAHGAFLCSVVGGNGLCAVAPSNGRMPCATVEIECNRY